MLWRSGIKIDQIEFQIEGEIIPHLLGVGDTNLHYLERKFRSDLVARGDKIIVRGPADEIQGIKKVFEDMVELVREQGQLSTSDLDTILMLSGFNSGLQKNESGPEKLIAIDVPTGVIRPRGTRQARYIRMMESYSIVFATGPAGTGKTFLAVAMAVDKFQRRQVDRIVLVRPVVESGESLGYLPGDILEKVDPYFRPLYDALQDMLTTERVKRLIERGQIEVSPLAYMRGRTLNNAFVILDEAQNTTSGQMKMFLTRLGSTSRAILTGDLTQIDLVNKKTSGLGEARNLLRGIEGIGFIEFNESDVVRHRLVAEILKAYKEGELKSESNSG